MSISPVDLEDYINAAVFANHHIFLLFAALHRKTYFLQKNIVMEYLVQQNISAVCITDYNKKTELSYIDTFALVCLSYWTKKVYIIKDTQLYKKERQNVTTRRGYRSEPTFP